MIFCYTWLPPPHLDLGLHDLPEGVAAASLRGEVLGLGPGRGVRVHGVGTRRWGPGVPGSSGEVLDE